MAITSDKFEKEHIELINTLSQLDMARLVRFAPSGHIYFDTRMPFYKIFNERFKELGGMTTVISKRIGW